MATKAATSGRDLLLDVAFDLFVRRGYAAVSMQEIAAAAGMTKGAPYYHFKSKDDLFLEIFTREIDRLKTGFIERFTADATFPERLRQAVIFVQESSRGDVKHLFTDFDYHVTPRLQQEQLVSFVPHIDITAAITPYFAAAAAAGTFGRTDPATAARLFMTLTMGQVELARFDQMAGRETPAPETLADEVVDLLLHGI